MSEKLKIHRCKDPNSTNELADKAQLRRRNYQVGTSGVYPKFVKSLVRLFSVIPAKTGIQRYLKFLDSGSR